MYLPASKGLKSPVLVFVYGGGWISGDKRMYALWGQQFSDLGYTVVVPNYTLFPAGDVGMMLADLFNCLLWIQRNIPTYGGDPVSNPGEGDVKMKQMC